MAPILLNFFLQINHLILLFLQGDSLKQMYSEESMFWMLVTFVLISSLIPSECLGVDKKAAANLHPLFTLLPPEVCNYIATFLAFPSQETDHELKNRLKKIKLRH